MVVSEMADNQNVINAIYTVQVVAKDLLIDYKGGHGGSVNEDIDTIEEQLELIKKYFKQERGFYSADHKFESVDNGKKKVKVADWYAEKYPDDAEVMYGANDIALGDIIPYMLDYDKDFYELVGVGDSVVRERIFEELANIYGVSYDDIYYLWLGDYGEISREALRKFGI